MYIRTCNQRRWVLIFTPSHSIVQMEYVVKKYHLTKQGSRVFVIILLFCGILHEPVQAAASVHFVYTVQTYVSHRLHVYLAQVKADSIVLYK